jgi:hypothetical protein
VKSRLTEHEQRLAATKDDSRALRRRYTWHFRRPFSDAFDRSHWWKGEEAKLEPAASLFELARRHPRVGEELLKTVVSESADRMVMVEDSLFWNTVPGSIRDKLYWTCRMGLKSWAKLDDTDRQNWKSAIALKGLDLRSEYFQSEFLNEVADLRPAVERIWGLRDKWVGKSEEEMLEIVEADAIAHPPTAGGRADALVKATLEADRRGDLLFALAPDLTPKRAGALIEKIYRRARRSYGKPPHRARWQEWLPLIAAFEDAEVSHGAYSQTFARYRRVIDGIDFD